MGTMTRLQQARDDVANHLKELIIREARNPEDRARLASIVVSHPEFQAELDGYTERIMEYAVGECIGAAEQVSLHVNLTHPDRPDA